MRLMTIELQDVVRRRRNGELTVPVNLRLEGGRVHVLLGRTGSGKSGLLRLLARLDAPVSGQLTWGQTPGGAEGGQIGLVVQEFVNYPSLTVYDNIAAPLANARLEAAVIEERVQSVAGRLGLLDVLRRRPGELSGGQQQRTALARALAKQAPLLLLDEPLVNLDFKLRESLREDLLQLLSDSGGEGRTVVYASTEPDEALLFSGGVVVLEDGAVLAAGPAADIHHRPPTLAVGRLTGDPAMNALEGLVGSANVACVAGVEFALPESLGQLEPGDYVFGFRPPAGFLSGGDHRTPALPARVELAELAGAETFVHLDVSGQQVIVREPGVHALAIGESVGLFLDPQRLYLFRRTGKLVAGPPEQGSPHGAH